MIVAGCATASRDVAFNGTEGTSYALLAVSDIVGVNSYTYGFKKVDRSNSTFQSDGFRIRIASDAGNLFKKPEGVGTGVNFVGEMVPPGEYALVSRTESSRYGLASADGSSCFSLGAPIFRIRKGQIQMISLGGGNAVNAVDMTRLQRDVEIILSAYPNMTAPISIAPVIGHITFDVSDPARCNPSGPYSPAE